MRIFYNLIVIYEGITTQNTTTQTGRVSFVRRRYRWWKPVEGSRNSQRSRNMDWTGRRWNAHWTRMLSGVRIRKRPNGLQHCDANRVVELWGALETVLGPYQMRLRRGCLFFLARWYRESGFERVLVPTKRRLSLRVSVRECSRYHPSLCLLPCCQT